MRKIAIHLLSNDASKLKEYYEDLYPLEKKLKKKQQKKNDLEKSQRLKQKQKKEQIPKIVK